MDQSVHRRRRYRRRCKSQSLVEFALILPIYLTMMLGVFDYGWMIGNSIILAQVSREGAITVARQTIDPMNRALAVMVESSEPRLDLDSEAGAAIIQQITYDTNVSVNVNLLYYYRETNQSPADLSCISIGLLFGGGDGLMNNSRIVPHYTNEFNTNLNYWRNVWRRCSFPPDNINQGQKMHVVEVWYTNSFVTPIGTLIGLVVPAYLYDAAYF